jgi:hypothetical protein
MKHRKLENTGLKRSASTLYIPTGYAYKPLPKATPQERLGAIARGFLQRKSNQALNAAANAVAKTAGATLRRIGKTSIGALPFKAAKLLKGTMYGGYTRQGFAKPRKR